MKLSTDAGQHQCHFNEHYTARDPREVLRSFQFLFRDVRTAKEGCQVGQSSLLREGGDSLT